ncbi:MAG: malto-oligosyltrehalose trehalohydrolase [Actinomycetales bacterium]|nr:malto-oligosyltrehalose trehalohydrolase [Actinomycetales bacterium]
MSAAGGNGAGGALPPRARVWAPRPQRVRVVVDGAEHPMTPGGGGWWEGPELAPGARYGFLLDDDPTPRPDPRARSLPDGVHGLAEAVAPTAAPTEGWAGRALPDSVIYELHVGTFTPEGTLDAAIDRLDHLVELGVDLVELLPVNAFEGRWNWGYDGVGWFAVDVDYAGPDRDAPAAYRRFVAAAHARGLGVIQDVVYNHLGPSGNYLPLFGPYLTDALTTWGEAVNLGEPEVRAFILDDARMWLEEYGVDGLRLDAVHALVDPTSRHLLAELSDRTARLAEQLGRPLSLIAESDLNDPVMIAPTAEGGRGMTAQWSDDYHHALHVAITGETSGYYADFAPLSALAKAATRGFFHDGTFSSFRGRPHGHPLPPETPAWRLVSFAQDHDQIGNRAAGDRLPAQLAASGLGPDAVERRLAVAALLDVLSPFTPMLFMGEEWAAGTPWQFFTAHEDPELGRATAEGRVAEFARMGWDPATVPDPQDPATFRRSKLDWGEPAQRDGVHTRMLARYRELIALRRSEPELHSPPLAALAAECDEERRTLALVRGGIVIRVNLGTEPWRIDTREERLWATDPEVAVGEGGLVLPPDTGLVSRR